MTTIPSIVLYVHPHTFEALKRQNAVVGSASSGTHPTPPTQPMMRAIMTRGFVLSEIMAFLKLHDAVHLLTALKHINPSFTPTPALWKEAFRTALHHRIRCRAAHTHTWRKHPETTFIEFTDFMRFIKATPIELKATVSERKKKKSQETIDDDEDNNDNNDNYASHTVSVVQKHANSSDVGSGGGTQCLIKSETGHALTVPCDVCPCGTVVLWACPVCLHPSAQCHTHSHMCLSCCESVCHGCVLPDADSVFHGEALCQSCGFVCGACGALRTNDAKLACAGPVPGTPCIAQHAPVCRAGPCALDFALCGGCARTACGACAAPTPCGGGCSKSFCPPCADALRMCDFCARMHCARCAKRTVTTCGKCAAVACGPCTAAEATHTCGICRTSVCAECGGMDACDSCGKRCCSVVSVANDGGMDGCSVWVEGALWDGCPSALQCASCARSSASKWPW